MEKEIAQIALDSVCMESEKELAKIMKEIIAAKKRNWFQDIVFDLTNPPEQSNRPIFSGMIVLLLFITVIFIGGVL